MSQSSVNRSPGDFLLSPLFLTSLATLLINDFYLKRTHPGPISGILSDIAGMIFFPILLVAVAEFVLFFTRWRQLAQPWWFAVASAVTALLFVVTKFTVWGETIYVRLTEPIVELGGDFLSLGTRGVVSDPWDLLALLLLPVPYLFGRSWRKKADPAPGEHGAGSE